MNKTNNKPALINAKGSYKGLLLQGCDVSDSYDHSNFDIEIRYSPNF